MSKALSAAAVLGLAACAPSKPVTVDPPVPSSDAPPQQPEPIAAAEPTLFVPPPALPEASLMLRTALSSRAPEADRLEAIAAVGRIRTRESAAALMRLARSEDGPLRESALIALAELTGLGTSLRDPDSWELWWRAHENLSERDWQAQLIENHARRADLTRDQVARLREQLASAQRALYRSTAETDRQTLLTTMLTDRTASTETRLLALELTVARLTENQPVGEDVRQALRALLDDASDTIRQRTATLLRDLADESGSDAVAQRLATDSERSESVLRAYLRVMSRLPRASAVPRAMQWLDHPTLGEESARALTAAADAGQLTPTQRGELAQRVRQELPESDPPPPALVELLSRVGDPEDWHRIEQWLDSAEEPVRLAAARAWAASDRSLLPLSRRAADPALQPIVLAAASRRGNQVQSMLDLVQRLPGDPREAAAWEQALTAMASRADPTRLLEVDQALRGQASRATLRDQILTAAINRLLPVTPGSNAPASVPVVEDPFVLSVQPDPQTLMQLLMLRSTLRLDRGDPAQALTDLERIAALPLELDTPTRLERDLGVIRARLGLGEIDQASDLAGRLMSGLKDQPQPLARVRGETLGLFLAAAGRAADADQPDRARALLARVRALLKNPQEPEAELWRLVEALEARLREATPPAPATPLGFAEPTLAPKPPADDDAPGR